MSDQTQAPLTFALGLKGVDTSYPSLATSPAGVRCRIVGFDQKDNAKGGSRIIVKLETDVAAQSSKGEALEPGFKFQTNLNLPHDPQNLTGENDKNFIKNICRFVDAVYGTDEHNRPDLEEAINGATGKPVLVTIKASKDTSFGDTEVSGFKNVDAA